MAGKGRGRKGSGLDLVHLELLRAESGSVALVTLHDPERRNALSLALVAELKTVMDTVEADDDIGAVVVTGAPPAFCAGADLGDLAAHSDRAGAAGAAGAAGPAEPTDPETGLRAIYEGFLRVARCPLPTVAAVNGAAVGAGMNLALACDLRVASRSAMFDTRFLELGLHPGGGHTFMLQRIGGPELARAMVLFGARLDGAAAAARGLAWACVDDASVVTEAVGLARTAASAPRQLAVRVKDTMGRVASLGNQDDAVATEIEAQIWSLGQPFFTQRLAARQGRQSGQSQQSHQSQRR
jgi:enoyl-CoA hydratase